MKTTTKKKTIAASDADSDKSLHIEGLTDKQAAFLPALLSYPTIKEACFSSGISEATAWRWLNEACA